MILKNSIKNQNLDDPISSKFFIDIYENWEKILQCAITQVLGNNWTIDEIENRFSRTVNGANVRYYLDNLPVFDIWTEVEDNTIIIKYKFLEEGNQMEWYKEKVKVILKNDNVSRQDIVDCIYQLYNFIEDILNNKKSIDNAKKEWEEVESCPICGQFPDYCVIEDERAQDVHSYYCSNCHIYLPDKCVTLEQAKNQWNSHVDILLMCLNRQNDKYED